METITMEKIMLNQNNFFLTTFLLFLTSCALSPGMSEPKKTEKYDFEVIELNSDIDMPKLNSGIYTISPGDKLSIVVFGVPELFPQVPNYENPYTSKIVDDKGEIFFPFAGTLTVEGKSISDVRNIITESLSKVFKNPQVDVSITQFNEKRNIYVLGEVSKSNVIKLGLVPITLSDAISLSGGISNNSSRGSRVFVIRSGSRLGNGVVYKANMNNASAFIVSSQFYLEPGDVVFVGAADITKWNRFITQLFPFASFLNQVDNIEN